MKCCDNEWGKPQIQLQLQIQPQSQLQMQLQMQPQSQLQMQPQSQLQLTNPSHSRQPLKTSAVNGDSRNLPISIRSSSQTKKKATRNRVA